MRRFFARGVVSASVLVLGCSGGSGAGTSTGLPRDGTEPGDAAKKGSTGTSDASAGPTFGIAEPGASAPASSGSAAEGSGSGSGTPTDPKVSTAPSTEVGQKQVRPDILTAGAWDDNRNFSRFLGYRSALSEAGLPGILPISEAELQTAHNAWLAALAPKQTLDVALIIDTTVSMGDEVGVRIRARPSSHFG
jgi:hypothetical protein